MSGFLNSIGHLRQHKLADGRDFGVLRNSLRRRRVNAHRSRVAQRKLDEVQDVRLEELERENEELEYTLVALMGLLVEKQVLTWEECEAIAQPGADDLNPTADGEGGLEDLPELS